MGTEAVISNDIDHGTCYPCHEDDSCDRCHAETPHAEPKYFDHEVTGFTLGEYHFDLTCRACHKRLFFIKKLSGDCTTCHGDWTAETFNHEVTGQRLDENHVDADCEDCHAEGEFVEPPGCDECHDEDEGISFPEKRPGELVERGGSRGSG
jgi:hypothetical protein